MNRYQNRMYPGGSTAPRRHMTVVPAAAAPGAVEDPGQSIRNAVLAMSYVPMQRWGALYEPGMALCKGTIFPQLDLPFTGKRCIK